MAKPKRRLPATPAPAARPRVNPIAAILRELWITLRTNRDAFLMVVCVLHVLLFLVFAGSVMSFGANLVTPEFGKTFPGAPLATPKPPRAAAASGTDADSSAPKALAGSTTATQSAADRPDAPLASAGMTKGTGVPSLPATVVYGVFTALAWGMLLAWRRGLREQFRFLCIFLTPGTLFAIYAAVRLGIAAWRG